MLAQIEPAGKIPMTSTPFVIAFEDVKRGDVGLVGGKNASLGEMIGALRPKGVDVPTGFATTADAFRVYLGANELDSAIETEMEKLSSGRQSLSATGKKVRQMILDGD